MITGIETAVLPAAARAAGSAVGKVAALPFGTVAGKFKNRAARKALKESGFDALKVHVPLETASEVVDFLESPDFESIALSVATQMYAGSSAREISAEFAQAPVIIKNQLSLRLTDKSMMSEVSQAVWSALLQKVAERVKEVRAADSLSAEARASLVKVAASFAAADAKNAGHLTQLTDLARFKDFEQQLADQVKNLHATMRLPHAGTTRKVPYSKLFVEPRLEFDIGKAESAHGRIVELKNLDEVLAANQRVVVLGDPGGGKSTLSLKLAYDIARNAFPASAARVPILFVLRDHIEGLRSGKETMSGILESICRNPYNIQPPAGAIDYLLENGRALIIFDGLDELTDTSLRRKVTDFVESFVYRYPATPVLVTSRKIGYSEAPLDDSLFFACTLAELQEEQVALYAKKWFSLDQSVDRKNRAELADSFVRESNFVQDLRRNPLMLSLMCGIYASEHYIPSNRPDVYQKCAELLFERWDKQRGIVIPLPFNAHVRLALNALAYQMYSDPKAQKGLNRQRLVQFVKGFLLSKRYDDEVEAEDAANRFVDFCTGRAWVLTDMGSDTQQNLYAFTHRTFLEYFAANQIVRANSSPDMLFDALHERIAKQEWEVVAQLAVQTLGQNVEDGGDEFLDLLLSAVEDTEEFTSKRNLAAFSVRALGFMVPRPDIIERICRIAISLDIEEVRDEEFRVTLLQQLMNCSPENLQMVVRFVKSTLEKVVESRPNDDVPLFYALNMIDASFLWPGKQIWRDVAEEINLSLAPLVPRHYEKAYWATRKGVLRGDVSVNQLVEGFGSGSLWFTTRGRSLWAPTWSSLLLNASFHPQALPPSDDFISSDVEDSCFSELSRILPRLEAPWVSNSELREAIAYDILRSCDGPVGRRLGTNKDGAFLMFLPVAEMLEKTGEFEHLSRGYAEFRGRTYGLLRKILFKLLTARVDQSFRRSAAATIRNLELSPEVKDFVMDWASGNFDLVEFHTEEQVSYRRASVQLFAGRAD
ncbi:NACHT domain-containing protein [Actinacidiphila guanduensis]|uniref:NACHT domain-containing protein n=2 Tax=Actinacidiphila guanduensis TaxID=310781 RepID=A0A1G9XUK3_9ACTN|nr:NACHT domain-containing protein [Actinacidiphila guanduensis]